ncbi:hypothetical protein RclHR1_01950016 [Rhizophagus clarus]|uniref:Uncharacterized protein n=1 Tax=Rhizophagus clarus TaxID=94130 RepID=A0A2Z6R2Y5_9GLOM|nr:hypothetical protein RclHR1_01950016 [Rhizophagus clarus]
MKKGFLLSKPAPKTASTSSTTKVTPTTALKSIPSGRFHDVIVDFISKIVDINSVFLLSSISPSDPTAINEFFECYPDQVVPLEQLSQRFLNYRGSHFVAQFLATLLNIFLLDDDHREIFLMDSEIRRALYSYLRNVNWVIDFVRHFPVKGKNFCTPEISVVMGRGRGLWTSVRVRVRKFYVPNILSEKEELFPADL